MKSDWSFTNFHLAFCYGFPIIEVKSRNNVEAGTSYKIGVKNTLLEIFGRA